jgi:RNA polymerase sigma-70 factor (ECF subfamily)
MHCDQLKLSEQEQRKLLASSAAGHHPSFETLIRMYQSKIRAYAQIYADNVNEHVDDLAQDIFLQVYLSANKYEGLSKVGTWIFSIAKHTINNKVRKKKLLYFWPLKSAAGSKKNDLLSDELPCEKDGEFYYAAKQNEALIKTCLAQMSREHREVLLLLEYSGLGYSEIAEVLNIRIGTVKSRLFNARKELATKVLAHHEH